MHRRAFTLIELLVVIAIIGLLSTIAVVSLNSAEMQARNAKRIADIKQFVNAFSMELIDNGSYPSSAGVPYNWACISTACTDDWSWVQASATVDNAIFGSGKYMATKPIDPVKNPRSRGGYLFNNNLLSVTSPYDGYVFPTGSYLDFSQETVGGAVVSCGPGRIYNLQQTFAECIVSLNQP